MTQGAKRIDLRGAGRGNPAREQRHESKRAAPWRVEDAPADFITSTLRAIVGIEIPLDSLRGKWKMSQNRPLSDREGMSRGLREQGDDQSLAVAGWVDRAAPKPAGG